jgi:hypothetical protein
MPTHYDDLPEDLSAALDILASTASELSDPWWVFGGAAMALSGLTEWRVPDVDVLCSARDAKKLIEGLYGEVAPDPGEGMFRSRVFGQILTTPVPVEVMAEMEVRNGGEWTPVTFDSRIPVAVDGGRIYIPSVAEQIETCKLFGRPKDLQRAELLQRLL